MMDKASAFQVPIVSVQIRSQCLLIFLSLIVVPCQLAFSQTVLTGKVIDQATGSPLVGAHIIFTKADSSFPQATISNKDGAFELNIQQSRGWLSYSFLGYQSRTILLQPKPSKFNLGTLALIPDTTLLKTIEITADQPLVYSKGDFPECASNGAHRSNPWNVFQ